MIALPQRLLDRAARSPDAPAIVVGGKSIAYGELREQVVAVNAHLRMMRLPAGARVALWMENSAEYAAALYGCWAAGLVSVPINPNAPAREAANVISHAGASLVIGPAGHALTEIGDRLGVATVAVRGDGCWLDELGPERDETCAAALDDRALILYTSGTTGSPKGVLLSHRNLAANTGSIIEYLGLSSADRVLAVLPFHYSYGNSVLHTHLAAGASLQIGPSMIYPQKVTDALRQPGITGFSGVPSTFRMLLDRTNWSSAVPRLRYLTQAGGAMGPALSRKLLSTLPPSTSLFVMYGQTEASARLTWLPPPRLSDKLGSVGVPIPGVAIRVVDEQGLDVAPGTVGEVIAKGANVMLGYWRNDASTERTLRDGWLRTGDTGYIDADGFLFLQGRRSDMIKTGAHRVNPEEIEEVIAELAFVRAVAACGVADEVLGQTIHVFVVGERDKDAERSLARYCRANLAPHKQPKTIHWCTALPLTASGKIKRHELAAVAEGPQCH